MELGQKTIILVIVRSKILRRKAGIRAADRIVVIDDTDATTITIVDAVKMIRGKGNKVKLEILRGTETVVRKFEIIRGTIIVKTIKLTIEKIQLLSI